MKKHFGFVLLLLLIVALGIGLRLYDLTDVPLDFHPTRQLFSALKARGMYYHSAPGVEDWQRQMAIQQEKMLATIEPPLIETLAAATYNRFGELLWIPRLYSISFWILGGVALYMLALDLSSRAGALVSLAFYLLLPYGVIASRSFQPDSLMTMLIIWSLWALSNWNKSPGWKWAISAGLFGGLAIFVKNVAVFPIGFSMASVVVTRLGLKRAFRSRDVYGMGLLSILPVLGYTLWGLFGAGFLGQQFDFRFFPNQWIEPAFYVRWYIQVEKVVGLWPLVFAVIGVMLADSKPRRSLLLGLWAGYLIYGFTFPHHITTHDYYQLPLIPTVALALAPLADEIWNRVIPPLTGFNAWAFAFLLIFILSVPTWHAYDALKQDYRPQATMWTEIGELLGQEGSVVSLTEDYGYSLRYWGWQSSTPWITTGDLSVRELANRKVEVFSRFSEVAGKRKYFLVTNFAELDRQPEIKALLYNYAIFAEGEGYIVFDLQHPLNP